MSLSSFNWWTWHCARQSQLKVLQTWKHWGAEMQKRCKAQPQSHLDCNKSSLLPELQDRPLLQNALQLPDTKIYKACTDMYRCKHLDKFNVLIHCIFFYDLNTTPFWTRPTCPSGSFQSKSRWGPDEDRRYCLYVATSETNSFNNWNSEKLLVMFSLNFELLIVSSSAWRRVSARRFGNTKHEGRGEKA